MAPVWEEPLNQYLVDISYPDQTRKRKRFSSLKKASAFGAHEMTAIEEGTWKNTFVPKNVTLGHALDQYREYTSLRLVVRMTRRFDTDSYVKRRFT